MTYRSTDARSGDTNSVSTAPGPLDPVFYHRPPQHYADLHTLHSAFVWEQPGHWCFSSFAEVSALLSDPRFGRTVFKLQSRQGQTGGEPRYGHHAEGRTLLSRALYTRRIESLRPRIRHHADTLIDALAAQGTAEVIASYARALPALAAVELLGLPVTMAPQLVDWANRVVTMHMFPENPDQAAEAASTSLAVYLRGVIAARRAAPKDDLLSDLLMATTDWPGLGEEDVISTAMIVLNAGYEATVASIGNALTTILKSRLDPVALFATRQQTAATVEECLRFYAPLPLFIRFAQTDLELAGGITIQKGDQIGLMLGAANHDPARFADPDRFDPFRSDGGNLGFGGGVHLCFGAPLARMVLQTGLKALFDRLPELRIAELEHDGTSQFRGMRRLVLTWQPPR